MGLLQRTAQIAEEYLATVGERRVGAALGFEEVLARLNAPLPEEGEDAERVLDALATLEPGMMATAGPRYFGFVTGGALPVTVAADWLVSTWDGPHFGRVVSPAGAAVQDGTSRWLLEALRLLGFGSGGVERIPADENGAMQPGPLAAALRRGSGAAIVCAQAGNVNTGACDPMLPIVAAAREAGAWVHVDG